MDLGCPSQQQIPATAREYHLHNNSALEAPKPRVPRPFHSVTQHAWADARVRCVYVGTRACARPRMCMCVGRRTIVLVVVDDTAGLHDGVVRKQMHHELRNVDRPQQPAVRMVPVGLRKTELCRLQCAGCHAHSV